MSCAACSARVEKAVMAVEGVASCSVNLLTGSMSVEGSAASEAVISAVVAAGYGAAKADSQPTKKDKKEFKDTETPIIKKRLWASVAFLAILMYISMGHTMWNFPLPEIISRNPMIVGVLQMLLSLSVMIINQRFFINGAKGLWRRSPNMDTLVALGSFASFGYSVYALLQMSNAQMTGDHALAVSFLHDLYFESAAMILTLITVGKLLEARAKGKTTSALEGLMRLTPKTATVLRDGVEIEIPADELRCGDVFVVRPGEQIPADGEVISGQSAVNESSLTGESIPVDKERGSLVSTGTINTSGAFRCKATRVGENTTLSQIIKMVSDASATKAPIAKIADRVSGVFVPAVIAVALITLVVWLAVGESFGFAIARSISVLVISCPCALGLATPVAVMVGTGVGAKNGILFKTAASLEECGKVKTVVLDKTGTITEGNPTVVGIYPERDVEEQELLSFAAALEKNSEHPLARAVMKASEERGISCSEVTEFSILPGSGLTARLGEDTLFGGNLRFAESKAQISAAARNAAAALAEEGKTPLFFIKNDKLIGIIAVSDVIKPDSKEAIRELHRMGKRVVMLTGDNERTANAIGGEVGVDEVIAGVLPDGKESVVRHLRKSGKVAMVGDGVNDAPALTRADIGIAIGAGTDIAIDAADVVLVNSRISDVPAAIRLSSKTLKNIKENLFWAFIYNVIGIPLAAGVWYPLLGLKLNPMFGAAAMSLSSVTVVSNALRLNFLRLRRNNQVNEAVSNENIIEKEEKTMKKTLKIEGMMCPHCEARVKKCLDGIEGVSESVVDHKSGTAVVTLSAEVKDDLLKKAVEDQGYPVTEIA